MNQKPMYTLKICIKGAGEMASGVAVRLYNANVKHILMLETEKPLAVRRKVSFCEAVYLGEQKVENAPAVLVRSHSEVSTAWENEKIAVLVDPEGKAIRDESFDVVIDATMAKRNLGTRISDASLVIGLGPGLEAGRDVHAVIETQRGHDLGRLIYEGFAAENTGIPGNIGGYTKERVLRSSEEGVLQAVAEIGDHVGSGEVIATVNGFEIRTRIDGVVRGLLKHGTPVTEGMKVGDIDPRGVLSYCDTVSEKARALGGAALEAILHFYNMNSR